MNISWVLGFYQYRNSGVTIYSKQLVKALKVNHDIVVNEIYCPFRSKIIYCYIWKYFLLPIKLIFSFRGVNVVIFPDESYSFCLPFCLFISKKIIIVHDYRDIKASSIREKIKKTLMRANHVFLRFASKVVFVSQFTKQSVEKNNVYTGFSSVIPNLIDFPDCGNDSAISFSILEKVDKYLEDASYVVFLYVGSDESRKNTVALAEAFNQLSKEYKNVLLVRAGRPVDLSLHSKFIEITSSNDRVITFSEIKFHELIYLYKKATFLVMPSIFEGFGRTPIEAQLLGLPVISTRATALEEVILKDSIIEISHPYDSSSIYDALEFALNSTSADMDNLRFRGLENAKRFSYLENYNLVRQRLLD